MTEAEVKKALSEVVKLVEAQLAAGKWDKKIEKISKSMSERKPAEK
jgi:hypothetical protein